MLGSKYAQIKFKRQFSPGGLLDFWNGGANVLIWDLKFGVLQIVWGLKFQGPEYTYLGSEI